MNACVDPLLYERTVAISACIADPFAAKQKDQPSVDAFTIPVRAQAAGCIGQPQG
jgi:hypothetical protein